MFRTTKKRNINPSSNLCKKALNVAIKNRNITVCNFLVNEKNVSVTKSVEDSPSPLVEAIKTKDINVIKLILNKFGQCELKILSKHMLEAINSENKEVIELLLKFGGKIELEQLISAAKENAQFCISLLDYISKEDQERLLSNCCMNGKKDFVKLFLSNENLKSSIKIEIPFSYACVYGQLEIVQLFVEGGVSVDVEIPYRYRGVQDEKWTPLMFAAKFKQKDVISYLIENKANVNAKSKKRFTSLHAAVSVDDLDCVKLLINNGADVNALDCVNWSPLHLAIKGSSSIVNFLRKSGAEMNQSIQSTIYPLEMSLENLSKLTSSEKTQKIFKKKCEICEATNGISLCGRCKKVYYCSREHQIKDWNQHKKNCN